MVVGHPVLELATQGRPGLVLHGGTGSFVAARGPDGAVHYAGGLGWRFGDAGSGYDLGRRAISRGLLELQGWAPPTPLGTAVRNHTQLGVAVDAAGVTKFFYQHADPNRQIAGLAPAVLRFAEEGDSVARGIVALAELLSTGSAAPDPIHFVSGVPTTLGQLATMAIRIAGTAANVCHAPPRNFDVAKFYGSLARAKRILGWEPAVPLETGLSRLIHDFRNVQGSMQSEERAS